MLVRLRLSNTPMCLPQMNLRLSRSRNIRQRSLAGLCSGFAFFFLLFTSLVGHADGPNLAFYYGTQPPVNELRHFDQIVVQPNQLRDVDLTQLLTSGPLIVGYVSVGEVNRSSVDFPTIDSGWQIGENSAWNSVIMDLANPAWRQYLMENHFAKLWAQGYRGFFLDTMDSYLLVAKQGDNRLREEAGLRELLRTIKTRFAGVSIIVNRGFDVLDTAHEYVDGLIAEAYFSGFDLQNQQYVAKSDADRQWLRNNLDKVKNVYHIPVTIVDYVAPGNIELAESRAREIDAMGFTPWIANGDLNTLGQGRRRVLPRRILALYDGPIDSQPDSELFRHLATPIEHLGYAIDYLNLEVQGLPLEPLSGRYAGVVSWLSDRTSGLQPGLCARLQKESLSGVRTAFFATLPEGENCRNWLQVKQNGHLPAAEVTVEKMLPPEAVDESIFRVRTRELADVFSSRENDVWLRLRDSTGAMYDPVFLSDFGGVALEPYLLDRRPGSDEEWMLAPEHFLQAALKLPSAPQFDVVTENGRRTAFTLLTSDGLMARTPEGEGAGSAWQKLITEFAEPVTLAVAEAELDGSDFSESEKASRVDTVKNLLALPDVELAAHSYSHPFFWRTFDGRRDTSALTYFYTLNQTGYLADLQREIVAPQQALNRLLGQAPEVLAWPGDAVPGPAALTTAKEAGIVNFGGGGVSFSNEHLSLASMYPLARPSPYGTQILSPLLAENDYARLFNGIALNYRKVVDWNLLLGGAERWRPWSLHVHLDAMARPDAELLLHDIFKETKAQSLLHLSLKQYVDRVMSLQTASMALNLDGSWDFMADNVHTLRVPATQDIDVSASTGLAGTVVEGAYRYLSLAASRARVVAGSSNGDMQLREANAPLLYWQRTTSNDAGADKTLLGDSDIVVLRFAARQSIFFSVTGEKDCVLEATAASASANSIKGKNEKSLIVFHLNRQQAEQEWRLVCH